MFMSKKYGLNSLYYGILALLNFLFVFILPFCSKFIVYCHSIAMIVSAYITALTNLVHLFLSNYVMISNKENVIF